MPSPYLHQQEIDEMCEPLINGAAQIRYLKQQGFIVLAKPNGKALLLRAHRDEVLRGIAMINEPMMRPSKIMGLAQTNKEALILAFRKA